MKDPREYDIVDPCGSKSIDRLVQRVIDMPLKRLMSRQETLMLWLLIDMLLALDPDGRERLLSQF